MKYSIIKVVAEVGSVLSAFSLALSSIIAYFSFESVGLNFFRVASLEDTILIGVGLLVNILPIAIMSIFQYLALRSVFGLTASLYHGIIGENGLRIEGSNPKYFFISLICSILTFVIIAVFTAKFYYSNAIFNFSLIIFSFSFMFFNMLITNFLLNKSLIRFTKNDPQYHLPRGIDNNEDSNKNIMLDKFDLKVKFFVCFLVLISFVWVLAYSIRDPLNAESEVVSTGDTLFDKKCSGSPVIWSGTRSIVVECEKRFYVLQGPQNIVILSDGRQRLRRNLEGFFGLM